jgi:hypothetical protein
LAQPCEAFLKRAQDRQSLDERFHETYRFHALDPHPEEQAFARRAKACVSKDGSLHGRRSSPSFETHRLRNAPQDEVRRGCRYDKNFGNGRLVTLQLDPEAAASTLPRRPFTPSAAPTAEFFERPQ